MKQFQYTVQNPLGLHAQNVSKIIDSVKNLNCNITFEKDNHVVNIKEMFSLLSLFVVKGDCLNIKIDGPDEEKAYEILRKVISREV
ncbi:MAG TPA: hypothetical protein DD429_01020 [Clostridiaceae bacterium]|nr:hypothetical protein [Clostridiaceae bacterium]